MKKSSQNTPFARASFRFFGKAPSAITALILATLDIIIKQTRMRAIIVWVTLLLFSSLGAVTYSADVVTYDAFKNRVYEQTTAAQPSAPDHYSFFARIFLDSSLSSATSTLTVPNSATYDMGSSGSLFIHQDTFTSEATMNATFPSGAYQYSLNSPDLNPNNQGGILNLPDPFYSLSIPYFTNFNSFSSINITQPFTFQWNQFQTNASAPLSQIFFTLYDNKTGAFVVNQFFPNSTTQSYTVPAGTMVLGDSYQASIYFSSRENTPNAGFNLANALASFDEVTAASLLTVPEPTSFTLAGVGSLLLASLTCLARRKSYKL